MGWPGARFSLLLAALLLAIAFPRSAYALDNPVLAPPPRVTSNETGLQTAIFAGGCFWGVEGVYSHTKGVVSAVSGYHGGTRASANYRAVSGGMTDHAEVVRVRYDPKIVRYDQLLQIFFSVVADPTTLNYQGPDRGRHYRTALVPMNDEQQKVAAAYLAQLKRSGVWKDPIVTAIEEYKVFYTAEAYHQDYMKKNPDKPYIVRWDAPKVAALKRFFPALYSSTFLVG